MEKKAKDGDFFKACDDAIASDMAPGGAACDASKCPVSDDVPLFKKVPRGRKVNSEFETAVMGKLLYVTVVNARDMTKRKVMPLSPEDQRNRVKVDAAKAAEKGPCGLVNYTCFSFATCDKGCCCFAAEFLSIVANITHSYAVIRKAAEATKKEWMETAKAKGTSCGRGLEKNTFSDKWIRSFLDRFNLSRQRITATIKADRPMPDEVQGIMAAVQAEIVKDGFEPCDILCVVKRRVAAQSC